LDLLTLDEALERLALLDSQQSRIVELRFFGGLTIEQAAESWGFRTPPSNGLADARAWLQREINN